MSVSFGSAVTSSNVNNAFVSKSADSTMAGVLDLNESSSGARVTNVQQDINNLKSKTNASATVASGGTITVLVNQREQYFRVSGNGGAQSLSSTPFGTAGNWTDGTIVRLVGTHDTNTISLDHSDTDNGAVLNGDCTLKKYNILSLIWDTELNRWIEISRNF
tara:strand:+ start:1017 stop:1502 length:486 start_codon:yes stop_codon:yes gene_type:complete